MRLIIALGVLLLAGRAEAYPEFQFSTGATRCAECHFAPAGGGLINAYGRDEAASTISDAGDGRFAHGAVELPAWLALGGDFRVAALGKRIREGTEGAVFPMQADAYVRLALGGLTLNATGGVLGAIREAAPVTERLGSREHYVMYQPASRAWYLRAGRMFPVFGLRLPDHTAYVRRYTGHHSLEESYQAGAGLVRGSWELHASVLAPFELHPVAGRHGWGGALYAERAGDVSSVGLQAQARRDADGVRSWLGSTYKRWFEDSDLLVMGELDLGFVTTDRSAERIGQLAGYASLAYRPGKAWGLAGGAHYYDPDVQLLGQERAALEGRFAWFPRAHFELALLVRGEGAVTELVRTNLLGLLQLHYYL